MQPIPSNILAELNEPFVLKAQQKAFFTKNGFIKIKQVFSKEVLDFMDTEISKEVSRLNKQHLDMKDRDTYGKAFLQIMNLWCNSEVVKEIVMGKRLAKIATELLNVSGVRIYHDQALYKEPSGGHTPWHADQYYWPLSNDRTVTAWIPLQATPLSLGPLEFCAESFQLSEGRDKKINTKEIAAIAYLSEHSFCRYFKSKTGKTYSNFLHEIRIKHACKLLTESKLTIAQIINECGFVNFTNFFRYFKQINGKTPAEYQKLYANEDFIHTQQD